MPQPVIRPEPLRRIAEEALVLPREAHQHIRYRLSAPEEPIMAPCDRRLIGQALANLLSNAADAIAMREGEGHIALDVARQGDWAVISVTDDGIGLPGGEERDRLTEPYVTHKVKGTGLGLAIVKKIMEDHGGRLVIEDAPPGPDGTAHGARVSLVLPWRAAGDHAMEGAPGADAQG